MDSLHCQTDAKISPDRLKDECEKILGDREGTIIVCDLKTGRPIVVLNPNIAYSRDVKPGSIFKLITAAALLEYGKIKPDEKIECKNYLRYQGRDYICSKPGGHGNVDLTTAIGVSCSIYFYRAAQRINANQLKKIALQFGLSQALPKNDTPAKPSPGVCEPPEDPRQFIQFAVGDDNGIRITPFQSANLVSIISVGKPLVGCGGLKHFSQKTLKLLREGMEIAARKGTCREIQASGISGAGKTGTSSHEHIPDKYHGWFVGFMPIQNPRYGIVVYLEDGRGYIEAVPIGVEVMKLLKPSVQR